MDQSAHSSSDAFFSGERKPVEISAGTTFLPCHFQKVQYHVALFKTDPKVLEGMLSGTGLKAALRWGRHGIVALGLIRYEQSDLGAYDEVILSIPSIPADITAPFSNWLDMTGPLASRKVGQYILHIPVTSTFSMAAGSELWGYPKIVTGIDHDFGRDAISSRVSDPDGRMIMTCSGKLGSWLPSIPLSLVTYSFRHDVPLRTAVRVRGRMRFFLQQSLTLQVGDSDHPMARDLRLMGLDGKRPLFVMDSDRFQSVFHEGREMMIDRGQRDRSV